MPTEANYVAGLAVRWARVNPMEQWVNAAPQGGTTPLVETISEYLGSHNPFPDDARVEVLGGLHRDAPAAWVPATIVERTAIDEGTVEFEDGHRAWRDHHELRPYSRDSVTDAAEQRLTPYVTVQEIPPDHRGGSRSAVTS